jgi:hypothetical protein
VPDSRLPQGKRRRQSGSTPQDRIVAGQRHDHSGGGGNLEPVQTVWNHRNPVVASTTHLVSVVTSRVPWCPAVDAVNAEVVQPIRDSMAANPRLLLSTGILDAVAVDRGYVQSRRTRRSR